MGHTKNTLVLTFTTGNLEFPDVFVFMIESHPLVLQLIIKRISDMQCFRNRKPWTSGFLWNQSLWEKRFSLKCCHMTWLNTVAFKRDFFSIFIWLKVIIWFLKSNFINLFLGKRSHQLLRINILVWVRVPSDQKHCMKLKLCFWWAKMHKA